jgi:hypothetical protein
MKTEKKNRQNKDQIVQEKVQALMLLKKKSHHAL